tara:strand:+ start:409 stop:588 length:180 start_codon:yes stop_codon:yes gene_type:complete
MAKRSHPLEMAFLSFDDSAKRYLKQVENSFKGMEEIPQVKQPKKRTKKNVYALTPFGKV